jgi:hypothetical protein
MKSIGIIANPRKPEVKETVQRIINWAEKNKVEFYLGQLWVKEAIPSWG